MKFGEFSRSEQLLEFFGEASWNYWSKKIDKIIAKKGLSDVEVDKFSLSKILQSFSFNIPALMFAPLWVAYHNDKFWIRTVAVAALGPAAMSIFIRGTDFTGNMKACQIFISLFLGIAFGCFGESSVLYSRMSEINEHGATKRKSVANAIIAALAIVTANAVLSVVLYGI